jgi:UDP-glucose 4-epimerase
MAFEPGVSDEVFNVANGRETSLEELCGIMIKAMGNNDIKPLYVPVPEYRGKVEVRRRLADTTKAFKRLGFKAGITLEKGLLELIAWLDAGEKGLKDKAEKG